jgi:hypothetical protein
LTHKNHYYKLRALEKEFLIKPKGGYCINCDNRHGCKSGTPPCLAAMMKEHVADMTGKQYLIDRNRTDLCGECPFFRSCWNGEEYDRLAKCGTGGSK